METDFDSLKTWVKKEYKKDWDSFYSQFSDKGKVKIRENQINLSRKSPEMAKYIGEKYLDDDKIKQKSTENSLNHIKKQLKIANFVQNDAEFSKLKQRQKDFVIYFLQTKIGDQSALKAGYSNRQESRRLLTNTTIKAIIDRYTLLEATQASDEKAKMIGKLDEIIDDPNSTPNEKINAIKAKAMLLGLNAPNKNQLLGKDGQPVDPVAPTIINKTYLQ
ncbi:MAG: terminase small subunit, partial [Flammeovirgaceae bacterium]